MRKLAFSNHEDRHKPFSDKRNIKTASPTLQFSQHRNHTELIHPLKQPVHVQQQAYMPIKEKKKGFFTSNESVTEIGNRIQSVNKKPITA